MKPSIPHVPLSPRELGELAQLLFKWPARQAPRLALPFFIFIAAIVQAGMLILFSISYKAPSETLPVSPQIYFLPVDSMASRLLAPWLEANDPASFSPIRAAQTAVPAPPPLQYRPSYEEPPPPLRPLPAETPGTMQPPALPLTGVMPLRIPFVGSATNLPPAVKSLTTVQWRDDLAGRIPASEMLPTPVPVTLDASPSLFQVGISAEGRPMHCVLLESSGDPSSDESARIWIMARRFQPSESDSWGRVLVLWGSPSAGVTSKPSPSSPKP
jgi:hypothetical protein